LSLRTGIPRGEEEKRALCNLKATLPSFSSLLVNWENPWFAKVEAMLLGDEKDLDVPVNKLRRLSSVVTAEHYTAPPPKP
jgi:hypothetical protein